MDTQSSISFGLSPSPEYSLESTGYNGLNNYGTDSIGNGLTPAQPNSGQTVTSTQTNTQTLVPVSTLTQLNGLNTGSFYSDGTPIVPTASGYTYHNSYTNSGLSGVNNIAATQNKTSMGPNGELITSFTGTDLRLLIECAATGQSSTYIELIECHTISVSAFRMKTPVRALGYTNPKGFARGLRTIAGTMVLTEMTVDVLLTLLLQVVVQDSSKDSQITLVDQLPPFNITMLFANEFGSTSYRTITGVEFLNDGTVYSVQDLLTERTISWMANSFTPLMPWDNSSTSYSNNGSSATTAENTPLLSMTQANTDYGSMASSPLQNVNNSTIYNG